MKLLIIDTDGVGLSIAMRSVAAGHEVKWFIKPKPENNPEETGKGFRGVEKVKNWLPFVKWADLILPTSNDDYVERLTKLKAQGFPVFGPTTESAKLEISRGDGMKILEKAGIEAAPYMTFKNMREALKHVEKTEERFVFKTLGDNEDKSLTYVSKHAADLIGWMNRMIEQKNEPKGDVMLQTFIEGIEMGVSRFVGKNGWVGQWNESFEHKKLMSGNYGPNTGEMGTVASFTTDSKLGRETLGKLEDELVKRGHTGDAALGFIIDKDGKPWPTEWTCRFGWPITNMMLAATKDDPVQWMVDALKGKDSTSFSEDIGVCLVMAHKDFPHGHAKPEEVSNVPIFGITNGNKHYIHPQGVKIDIMHDMAGEKVVKKPMWNTTTNYALVVTGFGDNVKQAADRAYKTAKQLTISNQILRDDVGEKLKESLPKLHKMGYATHFNYE